MPLLRFQEYGLAFPTYPYIEIHAPGCECQMQYSNMGFRPPEEAATVEEMVQRVKNRYEAPADVRIGSCLKVTP